MSCFDVVQWYDLDHPGLMRYSHRVKSFWNIGYKLFKERFVRFMGGYKNQGDGRIQITHTKDTVFF